MNVQTPLKPLVSQLFQDYKAHSDNMFLAQMALRALLSVILLYTSLSQQKELCFEN